MNDLIAVPVNIASLSAAITARTDALTLDSPPDELLAIIGLFETLESAIDRLALALDESVAA